jgi:hypothetical protein
MFHVLKSKRLVWLGIGLVVGLILSGLWPQAPLHAVATDRADTFAIATGFVDEGVEAVFFLDFLTGQLNAVVLGRQGRGFTASYGFNVSAHLGVDPAKNPKYLMVTGSADMRRAMGGTQLSPSVVYVAEVTTGNVGAYAIPWTKAAYATGRIMPPQLLVPLAVTKFRAAAAPGGIATPTLR